MKLNVMYFARYREAIGRERETVEGDFASVDAVRQWLILQGGHEVLAEQSLMCARNEELCPLQEGVVDGDEIAFFPTVTGG
jgi:molybdopterin synthase sulfur carrier subunit